jgi:hypothetical protein
MSFDLKYQSDFYNTPPYQKLVSVKIYKKDYGVHDLILLRTQAVTIEVNYQDENTPIIGTVAKINIINEGEFTSLEDLLTSLEKEFYCTIEYDGAIVFRGFSLCDLNEQQFLPWSNITLQFTDYLRKLEDIFVASDSEDSSGDEVYLNATGDISMPSSLFAIVNSALRIIFGIEQPLPLYINSTLFETTMAEDSDGSDCLIKQLWVENAMFFTSMTDFDDAYTALNKILRSLGAYFYSNGTRWILERQEDVFRTGTWVYFPDLVLGATVQSVANQKQEYNKQDDDFEYVNTSQVLQYASGLQKLILDLKDKPFDTFVFNDFTVDMATVDERYPVAEDLDFRKWYIYQEATPLAVGYSFRGMDKYFKWEYAIDLTYPVLYYSFEISFNASEDIPTELTINYKMSGDTDLTDALSATTKFYLRFDGGVLAGEYLGYESGPEESQILSYGDYWDFYNKQIFDTSTDKKTRTWTVSQTFNLTDNIVVPQPPGYPDDSLPSIWERLGKPTSQRFTIMFAPIYFVIKGNNNNIVETTNYIGDIEVTITQQQVLNKLTYYVNEDFIRTETVDIDFFDLTNKNFANGFLVGDVWNDLHKSELWTSEQSTTPQPLMDILARDRFRRYSRTIHKLVGTIMHDGYMKPFSVLTDDNLMFDSEYPIKLLLEKYTWDLNAGTYDIEATEYTEEEILVDESNELPAIPTGLWVNQPDAGEHMVVNWTAVATATGYTLQRMPWSYNPGYNNNSFTTIYTGANNTFNDDMQEEPAYGLLANNYTVYYKVSAYNVNGASLYCAIVSGTWYKA